MQAISFNYKDDGDYKEWKRLDKIMLEKLHELTVQSRYSFLKKQLYNNILKEDRRHYWDD